MAWASEAGSRARKLRAMTTSAIKGRTEASSWRHIAATPTAWFRAFTANAPFSKGSASSGNLFGSLKIGCAYTVLPALTKTRTFHENYYIRTASRKLMEDS